MTELDLQIRAREREDAEKYYLKHILASSPSYPGSPRFDEGKDLSKDRIFSHNLEHPRYYTLIEVHGPPNVEKKQAQTIAEELICIFLKRTF